MARRWIALALAVGVTLGLAAPALAHGGAIDSNQPASAFVEQAIGYLQVGNLSEARERLEGALDAKDRLGVDMKQLKDARRALRDDRMDMAMMELKAAVTHATDRQVYYDPLTPAFGGTGVEYGAIVAAALLALLGGWAIRRA